MRIHLAASIVALLAALPSLCAQQQESKKPTLGIPQDATLFNGKWYHLFLEKITWRRAQEKCRKLGGRLVCIHDAPTQAFISKFSKGLDLWIGATDEKVDGLWVWVDGKELDFKAWYRGEPNGGRRENYLISGWGGRGWADGPDNFGCVGFICEWPEK